MFQASPVGILALIAVAMCLSLAVAPHRVGAPGSVARKPALLLVVEGVTLVSSDYFDLMLTPAIHAHRLYRAWFDGQFAVHALGDCSMLALYPPFLAAALQTKLTQPFADKRIRIGLTCTSFLLFVAVMSTPRPWSATCRRALDLPDLVPDYSASRVQSG